MASKQLSELGDVSVPLKDSDFLLVSQYNAAQHVNQSKKAKVSVLADKLADKFQVKLDTLKFVMEQAFDEKYAKQTDVYTADQVEAKLNEIRPEGYLTVEDADVLYISKENFAESIDQINSDIGKKLSIVDAESDYAKSADVYSKSAIDTKFENKDEEIENTYAKLTNVYSKVEVNNLSDVYANSGNVYLKNDVDGILNTLSIDLESKISQTSPLSIKEFSDNQQSITAINNSINYVKITSISQIDITLPSFESDVVRNFYIVVDNSDKYSGTKFAFNADSTTKLYSSNEEVFDDVPANQIAVFQFIDMAKNGILQVVRSNLSPVDMSIVIPKKITVYLVITENSENKSIASTQVNEHSQYVLQPMHRDYMKLDSVTIKYGDESTIQLLPDSDGSGNYTIEDIGSSAVTITMSYITTDLHYIKFYDTFDGKTLLYPTYKVYNHTLYVSNDGISYAAYIDPTEIQLKFPEVDHLPYQKTWSFDITQYTTTTILDINNDIEVLATFNLEEE